MIGCWRISTTQKKVSVANGGERIVHNANHVLGLYLCKHMVLEVVWIFVKATCAIGKM